MGVHTMNAWQRLLAASSLTVGTAWDLFTHLKSGGGTTYNTALTTVVSGVKVAAQVADSAVRVSVGPPLAVYVPVYKPVGVIVPPAGVTAVVPPAPVVQITTKPINAPLNC